MKRMNSTKISENNQTKLTSRSLAGAWRAAVMNPVFAPMPANDPASNPEMTRHPFRVTVNVRKYFALKVKPIAQRRLRVNILTHVTPKLHGPVIGWVS